jgi:integrase
VKGKDAKRRNKLWYARDRADGVIEYFDTEAKAEAFKEDYNSNNRRRFYNIPPTNKALKEWTVAKLIHSYMRSDDYKTYREITEDDKEELVDSCELQDNLSLVLWKFSWLLICEKSLFDFTPQVAEKYVEDRLKKDTYISNGSEVEKTYSPTTVRRDRTTIQNAWKWARKNVPDLSNLENPWKEIHVPGTGGKRQRGLRKGELEKLLKHCEECRGSNRYYVPLAIKLAVDTGMRRQEIFNLTWENIDFRNRRITIEKAKNDWRQPAGEEGRVIFLPPMSTIRLLILKSSLRRDGLTPGRERFKIPAGYHPPKGKIFMGAKGEPMTGNGFKQAFEEVRDRAGIVDVNPRKRLTPHSLRAAAEMTFRRIGLIDKEIDIMKNGPKSHYDVVEDFLEMIQIKFDKEYFGEPLDIEGYFAERDRHEQEFQSLCKEGSREGLTREAAIERASAKMFDKYPEYVKLKEMYASLSSTQARLAEEVTSIKADAA